MVAFDYDYTNYPFLSFGGNVVAAIHAALDDGPFGLYFRQDVAKDFQACKTGLDLSAVHTTCAIFASSAWFWGGRPIKTRHHLGGPIVGGWLEGCFVNGKYWVHNDGQNAPDVGDILCFGYGAGIHHVAVSIDQSTDGTVLLAEGGQSPDLEMIEKVGLSREQVLHANGTIARIDKERKELAKIGVSGWFSAAKVAEIEGLNSSTY